MINKTLITLARKLLKELLAQCTVEQHIMFKKMYSHNGIETDIFLVVDKLDSDKLDHAITQVKNTITKNKIK